MNSKLHKKVFYGKVTRMFLSFLLTLALSSGLLSAASPAAFAAQSVPNAKAGNSTAIKSASQSNVYVALGDSVPAGYALSDQKDCCVNLFSDKMAESGYSNTMYNYAVSGSTTKDLLSSMNNMKSVSPAALQAIRHSTVITLNIGGNNVLGPLVKAVNEQLEQQFKDLGIKSIAQADKTQLWQIGLSLYSLKLDQAQLTSLEQGVQSFAKDFPKIIKWLKTNAPGAKIIVSTIYNPIPDNLSIYKSSEPLLKKMNAVITNGSGKNGYYAADVYSAFMKEQAKGSQILNLNLGQYKTAYSVDIHPNAVGHKLIAKEYYKIFKKYQAS